MVALNLEGEVIVSEKKQRRSLGWTGSPVSGWVNTKSRSLRVPYAIREALKHSERLMADEGGSWDPGTQLKQLLGRKPDPFDVDAARRNSPGLLIEIPHPGRVGF